MKTILEVHQDIEREKENIRFCETEREENKAIKRITLLNQCVLYLETNPTEAFIDKQKEQVKDRIKKIDAGFHDWCKLNPQDANAKNPKSKYNSYMGMKVLKQQLATINYLLS